MYRHAGNGATNAVDPSPSDVPFSARTYDHEGNLIARAEIAHPGNVRLFGWDYRNRLTVVVDYINYVDENNPGTLVLEVTYQYDVNNRRISKTVDADSSGPGAAQTTWFVYDGDQVAMQFRQGQARGQTFLYGPAVDQVLDQGRWA